MDRTKVPVKHEAKKAFFVALREAYLMWNQNKMEELEGYMKAAGMTEDQVKRERYYSPALYHGCVDRCIPRSKELFVRVRAVYAVFGHLKDSVTGRPLFNDAAWKRADNVLNEILLGLYSDPPSEKFYTIRLRENGTEMTNKYGMVMYDCSRGTNRVEGVHKDLIAIVRGWNTGVEMSVALLGERRHRHNQRVAEIRRLGYPKIGHYDIWLVEELQMLYLSNHGILLHPNVTNSSQYISTNESFDAVALQSISVHESLKERCREIENSKGSLPTLSRDLDYLSKASGSDLPYLPFSHADERIKYAEYAKDNFPVDCVTTAIHWNRSIVDGETLMPKLPVHVRTHKETFDRNQRIRAMHQKTADARSRLDRVNHITYQSMQSSSGTDNTLTEQQQSGTVTETAATAAASLELEYAPAVPEGLFGPIPLPPAFALPAVMALHSAPYSRVHTSTIGDAPSALAPPATLGRKRNVRKDKGKTHKRCTTVRKPNRCMTCVKNNGPNRHTCKGRMSRGKCQYFDTRASQILKLT